jgi:Pentapeptide repeats (9 copies)
MADLNCIFSGMLGALVPNEKADVERMLDGLLLQTDVRAWNEFRRSHPTRIEIEGRRFSGLRLSQVDLSNCSLRNSIFDSCQLENAIFVDCDLSRAVFSFCDLSLTLFEACDFSGARFESCEFPRARFDSCYFAACAFTSPKNLNAGQFHNSSGIQRADFPPELTEALYAISDFETGEQSEEDESSAEEAPIVIVGDRSYPLPHVPSRVAAPVEVRWVGNKLVLDIYEYDSLLGQRPLAEALQVYVEELRQFSSELKNSNIDQRIVARLNDLAVTFPEDIHEFSRSLFKVWYKLRPIFAYAKIAQHEQPDYVRARFLSLEGDLRDLLSSFPEWRVYEASANSLRLKDGFDFDKLSAAQVELERSLRKFPVMVDEPVVSSLQEISRAKKGSYWFDPTGAELHDIAASHANVVSRVLKKLIDEVGAGGLEGVRDATKTLVSSVMVGGGATVVWLITRGLGLFDWLSQAWEFVRKILSL